MLIFYVQCSEPRENESHIESEIKGGGLFALVMVLLKRLEKVASLPQRADTIDDDMKGHVVIPGMVNTHHHLFQNLTRAVPAAQNSELFDWLKTYCILFGVILGQSMFTGQPL